MTKSYSSSRMTSRSSHETHLKFSANRSNNFVFLGAVIHVMSPFKQRSRGVVRTTSPVALSLIIKIFIGLYFRQQARQTARLVDFVESTDGQDCPGRLFTTAPS